MTASASPVVLGGHDRGGMLWHRICLSDQTVIGRTAHARISLVVVRVVHLYEAGCINTV